jgi:stalled ribosome rescue protein Dom34
MSEYFDAVVYINRREAKLFRFSATSEVKLILTHTSAQRRHHQANHEDGTMHPLDDGFMKEVVGALDHGGNTLLCGPGNSKYELQGYMQQHAPDLAARVSAVQDLDEPNEGGILALARNFFHTRGHRHGALPKPSERHFDVPGKS